MIEQEGKLTLFKKNNLNLGKQDTIWGICEVCLSEEHFSPNLKIVNKYR